MQNKTTQKYQQIPKYKKKQNSKIQQIPQIPKKRRIQKVITFFRGYDQH